MKKSDITQTNLELAKQYLNIPFTYKKMCMALEMPILTGRQKIQQIKRLATWVELTKEEKPTRYIIKNIYEHQKVVKTIAHLSDDEEKYQEAIEFFDKRKLDLLKPLPFPIRNNYKISYYCRFHPDVLQTSTWKNLKITIGCPLCKYGSSRFEIMVFLGIENAVSRAKVEGVEFDIYIPSINTLVEIDGAYYHKDDTEENQKKKEIIAEQNNMKFLRIIEVAESNSSKLENGILYVSPYVTSSPKERQMIGQLLESYLPYQHSDELWDKAAEYLRQKKEDRNDEVTLIVPQGQRLIKQYSKTGELLKAYTLNELLETIAKENWQDSNWEIT